MGGKHKCALGRTQDSHRGKVTDVSFHKPLRGLGRKFNNLYGPKRAQPTPTENTASDQGANAPRFHNLLHPPPFPPSPRTPQAHSGPRALSSCPAGPRLIPRPSRAAAPLPRPPLDRGLGVRAPPGTPGGSSADLHRPRLVLLADQVHAGSPQCARGAARAARRSGGPGRGRVRPAGGGGARRGARVAAGGADG